MTSNRAVFFATLLCLGVPALWVAVGSPSFETDGIADPSGDTILKIPGVTGTIANYVRIENAETLEPAVITVDGSDTNPSLELRAKGTGNVKIEDSSSANIVVAEGVSSAVNYFTVSNASTGNGPIIETDSAVDAGVDLNLNTKGAGRVKVNSVDVMTVQFSKILGNGQDIPNSNEYGLGVLQNNAKIIEVSAWIDGGTNAVFNLYYGDDRAGSGTKVWTSNKTVTTTNPTEYSSFDNDDPERHDVLWLDLVSTSGFNAPCEFGMTVTLQLD